MTLTLHFACMCIVCYEREIGVYWYSFSNHCTRECIHKKSDKQTKVKFSFDLQIISSSLISAPSFWRSHVLHDMRLRLTTLPSTISSRAGLGVQCYALSSSARPLAPVLSPRPGAGWCCSLLASPGPLNTPYTIIDNLCTNSPITTLPDCSLLSVGSRRRPLSCLFSASTFRSPVAFPCYRSPSLDLLLSRLLCN